MEKKALLKQKNDETKKRIAKLLEKRDQIQN